MTYNTARPRDYAPLARVDLHLDDLNAFRDDAHTSVWAGYFVSGRDWETLTLVWRGDAANAVELAEKLPFRSWEVDDYQTSLDALVARGWLQAQDGAYIVTAAGAALRQSVEEATDERFYGFWDEALTTREQDELRTLLIRLKVQLESLAQPAGEV